MLHPRIIIDYKTAKFTAHQDEPFPMYEAQLNAYAFIGERCGFSPISKLALVYTEPVTDEAAAAKESNLTPEGFVMGFSAQILPVEVQSDLIPRLLKRAREVLDSSAPPKARPDCGDCSALKRLLEIAGK